MQCQEIESERQECWRVLRACGITAAFILLVGDFSCLKNRSYLERALPGTPQWEQCAKEYSQAMRVFQDSVKAGKVDLKANADVQMHLVSLFNRMDIAGGQVELVCRQSRKIFVDTWQPDSRWPEGLRQSILQDDGLRRQKADDVFHFEWMNYQQEARMKYNNLRPPLANISARPIVIWVVKWFYLMTIPCLLISLLYKRERGSTLKAELVLQYQQWLLAFVGGPIGMLVMSGTGAKSYRYYRLLEQFRRQHPEQFWPEPEEAQALWRQVEQPLLDFDQAIAAVRSGEVVRKPALVCLMVWLLGICHTSVVVKQVTEPVAVYLITSFTPDVSGITASDSGHYPLLLALLPQPFEEKIVIIEEQVGDRRKIEVKSTVRLTETLRGPPAAVKEQPRTSMSPILDCTMQKRG